MGWEPAWAVHPGEVLTEETSARDLSAADLAAGTGVAVEVIAEVLAERAPVTADLAQRLSAYLGTSAELWLNLQATYDRHQAKAR